MTGEGEWIWKGCVALFQFKLGVALPFVSLNTAWVDEFALLRSLLLAGTHYDWGLIGDIAFVDEIPASSFSASGGFGGH